MSFPEFIDKQLLRSLVVSLCLVILFTWTFQKDAKAKWAKLPPQVPGLPVLGNTLQVPALQQGPWAKDLAAKYGEM